MQYKTIHAWDAWVLEVGILYQIRFANPNRQSDDGTRCLLFMPLRFCCSPFEVSDYLNLANRLPRLLTLFCLTRLPFKKWAHYGPLVVSAKLFKRGNVWEASKSICAANPCVILFELACRSQWDDWNHPGQANQAEGLSILGLGNFQTFVRSAREVCMHCEECNLN